MYDPTRRGATVELAPEEEQEQVPRVLLCVHRPVRLLERRQCGAGVRTADEPEVAVHLVGCRQLANERSVVTTGRRRPHALRDLAADPAEVGDDAGCRSPREAVVVTDQRGRSPAELLVDDLPETGVPLRAVTVVAEDVLRCDLHRRILRPGGADDHGLLRVGLRPVGDRDSLVTGQRADHHVAAELAHETPRLLERQRRRLVAAADADDLEVLATGRAADHPCRRLLLVLRLGPRVLRERRDGAGRVDLVAERERALAVGHDRDLDVACPPPSAATAPTTRVIPITTSSASGSNSFHLRALILPSLSVLHAQRGFDLPTVSLRQVARW